MSGQTPRRVWPDVIEISDDDSDIKSTPAVQHPRAKQQSAHSQITSPDDDTDLGSDLEPRLHAPPRHTLRARKRAKLAPAVTLGQPRPAGPSLRERSMDTRTSSEDDTPSTSSSEGLGRPPVWCASGDAKRPNLRPQEERPVNPARHHARKETRTAGGGGASAPVRVTATLSTTTAPFDVCPAFPGLVPRDNRSHLTYRTTAKPTLRQRADDAPGPARNNAATEVTREGPMESALTRRPRPEETRPKTPSPAPYYYDAKLDVDMFCGPGYEQFPVALGTVPGHQEICDQWDRLQLRKAQKKDTKLCRSINRPTPPITDLESSGESEDWMDDVGRAEEEMRCLQKILDVFPDIQMNFLLEVIRSHARPPNAAAAEIVAEILDMDFYPKEKFNGGLKASEEAATDGTGVTITWNKDLPKDSTYLKEAVIVLAAQFDHVPTHYIHRIVQEKNSVFNTYLDLHDTDANYFALPDRPYIRPRHPRAVLEKKYANTGCVRHDGEQYKNIVNELQAARQHVAREAIRLKNQKAMEEAEATNLAIHKAEGALVECQCCFDGEIPINRAVACEGERVHFFCFECVSRLAESQVGSMKYEMLCMDCSGCRASLSLEGVGKAVPIKTFDRLAFNRQQAEISAAGIEGLEQCPFCDFKAICDSVETDPVFNCQNPDCGRSSCRKCKEDSHRPKSCEEVKHDRGLSARHLVEEARSAAIMRPCPKCGVKIIKEMGCNKMHCTTCGCNMCYVCKADISHVGYDHFHKSGAKCKLHDDQGVDRHAREANEAEIDAIKKAKAEYADVDEKRLRIETADEPKKGKKKKAASSAAALPPPNVLPEFPYMFADHLLDYVNDVEQRHQRMRHHHREALDRVREVQNLMGNRPKNLIATLGLVTGNLPRRLDQPAQGTRDHQQRAAGLERVHDWIGRGADTQVPTEPEMPIFQSQPLPALPLMFERQGNRPVGGLDGNDLGIPNGPTPKQKDRAAFTLGLDNGVNNSTASLNPKIGGLRPTGMPHFAGAAMQSQPPRPPGDKRKSVDDFFNLTGYASYDGLGL